MGEWDVADRLRNQLSEDGYTLEDAKAGVRIRSGGNIWWVPEDKRQPVTQAR
jgi:hypothetical protein